MFWYIAILAVGLLIGSQMGPKPSNTPPASFDSFSAPTAEEGREIPVLFGTRDITGPNVVWYGDFKSRAVKKEGGKG